MSLVGLIASTILLRQDPQVVDHGAAWVGKVAKSVVVKDEDGKDIDLSKQFGKRPVVLVFYRGVW